MSWLLLALIALVFWSGSDFFSKLGSHPDDKLSHWKLVAMVGLVMGLHAAYSVFFGGVEFRPISLLIYLPASLLYIAAMVFGYISLRYIELSMSSPICNASGAVAAVFCFFLLGEVMDVPLLVGVIVVCVGVVLLGVVQMTEDDELHKRRQEKASVKYTKSVIALALPVMYCLIDAAGTVADSMILEHEVLSADEANIAYELTFLFLGLIAGGYVLTMSIIKKEKPLLRREAPKLVGAICETAGQVAYIYAIDAFAIGAAPVISAYCMLSAVWSHIFLKEKLSWKHYAAIGIVLAGILLLGVVEGLSPE